MQFRGVRLQDSKVHSIKESCDVLLVQREWGVLLCVVSNASQLHRTFAYWKSFVQGWSGGYCDDSACRGMASGDMQQEVAETKLKISSLEQRLDDQRKKVENKTADSRDEEVARE